MRTAHKRAAEGETGDPAPSSDEEQQQHFSGKRIAVAAEVFDAVAQLDDGLRDKSIRSYVTQLKHYVVGCAGIAIRVLTADRIDFTICSDGARAKNPEDIVTAFLSLGARNPSHGVLNSCNVFASIAGAHKKHAMQQSMAAWGQLPKATKDLYKQAAQQMNDVQGRVRKATRVASKK
ncbi:hypothetical protein QJQ45_025650 [Haematococcus lacustris]|nr:hypothetical protein QJQ45_025650 [Haematococcus lacustris]